MRYHTSLPFPSYAYTWQCGKALNAAYYGCLGVNVKQQFSLQAQVLNLLQTLKHDLVLTYLFISHDLLVIAYLSDRVLVMYLGQIMEMGSTDEVAAAPLHPSGCGGSAPPPIPRPPRSS